MVFKTFCIKKSTLQKDVYAKPLKSKVTYMIGD